MSNLSMVCIISSGMPHDAEDSFSSASEGSGKTVQPIYPGSLLTRALLRLESTMDLLCH